jgi:hypothetical protein
MKIQIKSLAQILTILGIVLMAGCKGGGGQFQDLDTSKDETLVKPPVIVKIKTVSPTINPINLPSTSVTTFGIQLEDIDSTVSYNFLLDDVTSLQNGANPYFNLDAQDISFGPHTLKVIASNSISSETHTFNIIKNSPPAIVSSIPFLTGTNLNCGADSSNFTAIYSEVDATDTIQIKWYLDGSQVSPINSTITTTNDPANNVATINFHPDCTQTGVHFIRLDLNDGKEITQQTWTVNIIAPITINISDSTPTTDPTVLTSTNNATFAVSLSTPDPSANYLFLLDGVTPLQNSRRAYLNVLGSTLTPGTHTLAVTASNTTSSATKIFNIRRNSPPQVTGFSPVLSGTEVNCGTTPVAFNSDIIDVNGDSLAMTWTVDDAISPYLAQANTATKAVASFTPHCSLTGTRIIKVTVSDGYESTQLSWSITIKSPIPVVISSFTPTSNPTILLGNTVTTFGVALTSSDQNITYNFSLKNLSTLVVSTLQSGTVPFYNLNASTIAAGLF